MWFKKLTGFEELNPDQVRENLLIDKDCFISKINNRRIQFGTLEIPTVKELKNKSSITNYKSKISVQQIIGDVQELHKDMRNKNAVFQAASQFNLLEMTGPDVTPESGIDQYERDHTQGPACAIACGGGTIFRNYFVKLNHQIGQTSTNQIDCLELIGDFLANENQNLWIMKNGYALINAEGIMQLNKKVAKLSNPEREDVKERLKVGIQWNTEVTISNEKQKVNQVYCSALPVAYGQIESFYWENFARIILEATYEATLHASLINFEKTQCNLVYLTLVGGGAFGNEEHWIIESLKQAILKFKNTPLDVRIVSFEKPNKELAKQIEKLKRKINIDKGLNIFRSYLFPKKSSE